MSVTNCRATFTCFLVGCNEGPNSCGNLGSLKVKPHSLVAYCKGIDVFLWNILKYTAGCSCDCELVLRFILISQVNDSILISRVGYCCLTAARGRTLAFSL